MRFMGLMLCLILAAPVAQAGERDHDRARRAVEAGEIKPLREVLAEAEKAHNGRLIEAELESKDGKMVYELKLLTVEGRVLKVYYDARSGALLKVDRPHSRE
ncbi:MAG: PepSY domain-containing protein [Ferrovibrio sp.]|uniref:PepSY domain-containing protein n=1 Tax=Ferrovibrio sp. TaxID=1917215 RepID=UPI00260D97FE|nr:PepSY domain-containing protein [Ferrovibrio sp.]MCW0235370.1 PepSY domain-containing protein [Ferrovibrio sp.]